MKVNVKGTMLMCHAAVEAFRRRSSNGHPADSAAIVRAHVRQFTVAAAQSSLAGTAVLATTVIYAKPTTLQWERCIVHR